MRAIKAPKNLFAWAIVGLLVVVILSISDLRADEVLGLLQGLLIFGLLGIAVMLRGTIVLRFWAALIHWLRSFGRGG